MRTVDPATWANNKSKLGVKPTWQQTQGLEARLRRSLLDATREYAAHCTLKGLRHTRDTSTSVHMRRCYGFVIGFLVVWGSSVVGYAMYDQRMRPPLQVNLETSADSPPVNFPAVALCSNCAVSQKALQMYADELAAKDNNSTYNTNQIKNYLMQFGALINLSRPKYESLQFLKFLYTIDKDFNITDALYRLAPKCSTILKKCSWRGHRMDCALLFAERATPIGFCCVFNARYHPADTNNAPKTLEIPGKNFGLSVVVGEDRDDFSVVRRPTLGLQVLLFEGSEYPLLESGVVRSYSVNVNASVYFQLKAHAQFMSNSLKGYSESWRGCRISRLEPGPRSALSSYPWCLVYCRRFTTLAVCDCLPYYLLPNDSDTVCTTEHLHCLYKHKEKLVYYYPGEDQDSSLDEERQNSQTCSDCVPDCARLTHSAAVFQTSYGSRQKLLRNHFANGVSLINSTILRFYYATINHRVYKVEINSTWAELFASISCQFWFLLGCSLVCVAELVFHLTIRWSHHFRKRTRQMRTIKQLYY